MEEKREGGMRDLKQDMTGTGRVKYSILCIFTPTGNTFTFKNVEVACNNETFLIFDYSAVSDGKAKTATFPKATLCGWSITPA